ncbi:MAG: CpaF family protein, partial [Myxococcales bacterium]|nr:CpaF family protein [Myxococcales bacterium]
MARPKLAASGPVPSERDEAFLSAQRKTVQKVFAQIDGSNLPSSYPPSSAEMAEYERAVDRAIDSVASDGSLDNVDRARLMSVVTFELVGLGPVELYIDDPTVDRIYVNSHDRIFIRRAGQTVPASFAFSSAEMLELAARRIEKAGQQHDDVASAVRLSDGTHIDVVFPPVAVDGPSIVIRKPSAETRDLEGLVDAGVLSKEMATFVHQAVQAKRNILVTGPAGAGKAEFLSAIANTIPDGTRILCVEENSPLNLGQSSVLHLESAGAGALDHANRLSPDRLVVCDLTPDTALQWVLCSAYTALGSMASITGFGDRDALSRLESMTAAHASMHSIRGIRQQVSRAVQVVVVLSAWPGQSPRVTQ